MNVKNRVIAIALGTGAVLALNHRWRGGVQNTTKKDAELMEMAAGLTIPIARAVEMVSDAAPGVVVEVRLGERGDRLVWQAVVVTSDRTVVPVELDAISGEILERGEVLA